MFTLKSPTRISLDVYEGSIERRRLVKEMRSAEEGGRLKQAKWKFKFWKMTEMDKNSREYEKGCALKERVGVKRAHIL